MLWKIKGMKIDFYLPRTIRSDKETDTFYLNISELSDRKFFEDEKHECELNWRHEYSYVCVSGKHIALTILLEGRNCFVFLKLA